MQEILKKIPKNPGIYQFLNKKGEIIYIGKSVNLKARVNSYFNGKTKLNFAKQKMVEQICDIKTILTNNETESIILETTLIKKHLPKYNILMKDGKNHIYLKITSEPIPKLIRTRTPPSVPPLNKGRLGGVYFGPYTSSNYVNNIIKITKKIFGHRSCNIIFQPSENSFQMKSIGGTKIPCIDYHIGRCSGPCLLEKTKIESYLQSIEQIKLFLKGNNKALIRKLEEDMKQKAQRLEFEEAQKIKENLESIQSLEMNQIVRDGVQGNFDVVHVIEKFEKYFLGLIEIRESKITGFYNYEVTNELQEDKETIVLNFIERRFSESNEDKITFIVPIEIQNPSQPPLVRGGEDHKFPPGQGGTKGGFGIQGLRGAIEIPKIGVKKELLELCYKNIYEYACKRHLDSLSTKGFTKKTMQNILELLGYTPINKSIVFECNDISHISGNHTVASRSIIEDGKTNPSKYRKLKIKTLEEGKIDDFSSMKEVMTRRIQEMEKTGYIPDLIIIDGGKGQLSSVMKILNSSLSQDLTPPLSQGEGEKKLSKLQIVSIAKKEEELFITHPPTPSLHMNGRRKNEYTFKKIILEKDSMELRLIQKIRDEAHRFAITFNRDSRIKSMKKNILESIPGIGPKTRKKILSEYGSVSNLEKIDKKTLESHLGKKVIEALENHGII